MHSIECPHTSFCNFHAVRIDLFTYLVFTYICVYSYCTLAIGSNWERHQQAADLKADHLLDVDTITVASSLQRATIGEIVLTTVNSMCIQLYFRV